MHHRQKRKRKNTLLKAIAGILLPRKDVKAAYMPQNYDDMLDLKLTPAAFLSMSGDKDEITRINTILGNSASPNYRASRRLSFCF